MPRLYTYIVRRDTGLAPNPYWGWCTLAVCTPNHQGSRVEPDDWVAGFLDKSRSHCFLYAMEVSEIMGLDEYFHDQSFAKKKPDLRGNWKQRCGDNFYSKRKDGTWTQHRNRFHLGEAIKAQDTKYAKVFIGSRFWYLGRSARSIPSNLAPLVGGRGARVNHDPILADRFRDWVQSRFSPGILDLPNDNPDLSVSAEEIAVAPCSSRTNPPKNSDCN